MGGTHYTVTSSNTPLRSNPARQAIPTLKGFSYQIWQSLYRWVSLGDDEILHLEGAEDIDLLIDGRAETIQVKETRGSGAVTLRSTDILDAINHFWQHQENNPSLTITFRFLTTAERGHERPNPFTPLKGLDHWDSCKYPDTDVAPLRTFLLSQQILSDALRAFIVSASDEQLREQLIRRLEWDTGNKVRPYVEDAIKRRVEAHGDRVYNLSPSESIKVVPHLLNHVWTIICQRDDRHLDRSSFLRLFEEVTMERIPKSELQSLRRASSNRRQSSGNADPFNFANYTREHLPETLFERVVVSTKDRMAKRRELVLSLQSRLNTTGFLVLKGTTGMGKSTLANSIAGAGGDEWRRLDMRGRSPEQISDRLQYAAQIIESYPTRIDCIIDDLNFDKQVLVYENALAKFIYIATLRTNRVIITTQGMLPTRIINLYDIPETCLIDIPTLSEDEAKELTRNHGCPQGHKLKAWSRLIFLYSQGHPQLAHARVRTLETKGWPAYTPDDIGITQDIQEVRREIRGRLRDELPSNEARQLVYRLSLLTNRFERAHALHMGNHSPRLTTPGEAFDALIGPWLERVDDAYYRVSPLLSNAATEVFAPDEVKSLHKTAAEAYLTKKVVSPSELSAILFHALLGEAREPLSGVLHATLHIEEENWAELSRVFDWFGVVRLELGEKLFATDVLISHMLRRLQFKIVAEVDGTRALQVARVWERELENWDGRGAYPGSKATMRFAFLNELIFDLRVPLAMKTVAAYIAEVLPLASNANLHFPNHARYREEFDVNVQQKITAAMYIRFSVARCENAREVLEFLAALDEQSREVAEETWNVFNKDEHLAMLLIDTAWLKEAKVSQPDWARCAVELDRIVELGVKRKTDSIVAAAYRAKALIQAEYLKETERALGTLVEGTVKLGHTHAFLRDYQAKIYLFQERYEDALAIWDTVLSQFEREENDARVFSYRDAEICAAKLGDWNKAIDFAFRGEASARQSSASHVAVGYKADHALALWKSGDKAEGVAAFAQVLDEFKYLPDPADNIKVNTLYKRIGHAIAWMSHDLRGDTSFFEPAPGCFSNQESFEEIVKDLPMQQPVLLWFLLAKLECRTGTNDTIFKRLEIEHQKVDLPGSRVGYNELRLKHALAILSTEHLISHALEYSASLRIFVADEEPPVPGWTDTKLVINLLFAALINLVGKNHQQSTPVPEWRRDAATHSELNDDLFAWLDFVERMLKADESELSMTLKNESLHGDFRSVSALLLSASDSVRAEDRFYANVILVITNSYDGWQDETEDVVASLLSKSWVMVVEQERFSLRLPSVNAEIISKACNDNSCRGFKKAARILLAAHGAVGTRISDEIMNQLKRMAY